jgi:hypothetical protein
VGNDGETLVADSSASVGIRYQANFAAGKNKIINGDFRINQRSFTSVSATGYCFDRWYAVVQGASQTYTPQVFTPGAAPVAGYEGTNFLRIVTVAGASNYAIINQRIEDVRTFAGQTVTVSFWAKAGSGTPSVGLVVSQNFGSGGSATVDVYPTAPTTQSITTSWVRYSFNVSIPSISGKTIGTSSFLDVSIQPNNAFQPVGQQTGTFDFWGVQVEASNTATAFQTATGTIQGELSACQRYYWRQSAVGVNNYFTAGGLVESSTSGWATLIPPVTMRVTPTSVDYSGLILSDSAGAAFAPSAVTVFANGSGTNTVRVSTTISGATAGRWAYLRANSTNDYIGLGAEL